MKIFNKPSLSFRKCVVVLQLFEEEQLSVAGWLPSDRFLDTKRNREHLTNSDCDRQPPRSPLPPPQRTRCCLAPTSLRPKIFFTMEGKKKKSVCLRESESSLDC